MERNFEFYPLCTFPNTNTPTHTLFPATEKMDPKCTIVQGLGTPVVSALSVLCHAKGFFFLNLEQ